MNTIDLNTPPPKHNFSVSVSPVETDGERRVRLAKDLILFLVAIALVIIMFFVCYNTLMSATTSSEEKKWAMSVLSLAMGGLVGYLVKK